MWKDIRSLWSMLSPAQHRQIIMLQGLILTMALVEVIGVASILPFMTIVSNPDVLSGETFLAQLYQASGATSHDIFLFWSGVAVLGLLALSSLTSILTSWHIIHTGQRLGADLSIRLYQHYLLQPWLFHSTHHSATLTNHIAGECHRVMSQIINPLLQLNARIATSTLLLVTVFLVNPVAAAIGAVAFFSIYAVLFMTVRRRLSHIGEQTSAAGRRRYRLMTEGFGAIKELMLLGRQPQFIADYTDSAHDLARQQGNMNALAQLPRYLVELTAFGAVIMLVLYLLRADNGDSSTLLPLLSLYALAGFKLLPAFQQIYASLAQIRGNLPAFHAIKEDLEISQQTQLPQTVATEAVRPQQQIALEKVSFTYPGKSEPALNQISLSIPVNHSAAFVGPSGAGKSTCVDMILGMLPPDSGKLTVDDQTISDHNRRAWQNSIGYVPQSIYLADASIRDNIALGLSRGDIDEERLERAAALAHINEFVDQLPDGLNTLVGERGVQLSGGQRQRIGIARALYHDPAVVVLDEATSALDTISERHIMDAIADMRQQKTVIIIAHRLSTIQHCDTIFVIDHGHLVGTGTFAELSHKNGIFQTLVSHSEFS
ncbi:ABC transporter ATP-binding protein [Pseudohongiella spirulinae]|uniref:Multidrug ABC transporter ATPase n=1 Tax=Pseudohongiella spirulinae TaxID=1249552 RepID=A0A0S2KDL5_9GAMM|nr:ABC transporter ATP-binding protein [Pseudohongiella spirulinae]ALO46401.1 Multidrug ABC transporter ATPase [Pseudohongiella spirulinae]